MLKYKIRFHSPLENLKIKRLKASIFVKGIDIVKLRSPLSVLTPTTISQDRAPGTETNDLLWASAAY
jgi:hypothetical protein